MATLRTVFILALVLVSIPALYAASAPMRGGVATAGSAGVDAASWGRKLLDQQGGEEEEVGEMTEDGLDEAVRVLLSWKKFKNAVNQAAKSEAGQKAGGLVKNVVKKGGKEALTAAVNAFRSGKGAKGALQPLSVMVGFLQGNPVSHWSGGVNLVEAPFTALHPCIRPCLSMFPTAVATAASEDLAPAGQLSEPLGVNLWMAPAVKQGDILVFQWFTETHDVQHFKNIFASKACSFFSTMPLTSASQFSMRLFQEEVGEATDGLDEAVRVLLSWKKIKNAANQAAKSEAGQKAGGLVKNVVKKGGKEALTAAVNAYRSGKGAKGALQAGVGSFVKTAKTII
ncbi:unnamed protein product [Closterium sp. NIES-64]|nr:unnamed protein product [Closterium sp. NIES-64]